jgi:hypothetical protein
MRALGHGAPLIRLKPEDVIAAGVERVPPVIPWRTMLRPSVA